jgi:hypothetical protein
MVLTSAHSRNYAPSELLSELLSELCSERKRCRECRAQQAVIFVQIMAGVRSNAQGQRQGHSGKPAAARVRFRRATRGTVEHLKQARRSTGGLPGLFMRAKD